MPDQYGNTLLHISTKKGNVGLVHDLITLGVDANLLNKDGHTALDIANNAILKNNNNDHIDIAQLLINYNNINNNLSSTPQEFNTKAITIAINHITNTHFVVPLNKDESIQLINNSIVKIQKILQSSNVPISKVEEANALCSKAKDCILQQSPQTQNSVNLDIAKEAVSDTTNNAQLPKQQNHETVFSYNQVSGSPKIKPPVPPKPKIINKDSLLQQKYVAEPKIENKAQCTDNDQLHEIDQIMAECTQSFSDQHTHLLGMDNFVQ
ncbi:ankyrin repeat domain-containing protein [Rickettsia sp. TH2014]|uniref:ankyrin repeat domain-containing protein n=1 Tax=Rickettsia sp. TH2014 TaxID=1967503 RepID=UPI001C4824DF|nr:ankyrin repeat domain-containing protein [Rickettsia sp. TH2014]